MDSQIVHGHLRMPQNTRVRLQEHSHYQLLWPAFAFQGQSRRTNAIILIATSQRKYICIQYTFCGSTIPTNNVKKLIHKMAESQPS